MLEVVRDGLRAAEFKYFLRRPFDEGLVVLVEVVFADHAHSLELGAEVESANQSVPKFSRLILHLGHGRL